MQKRIFVLSLVYLISTPGFTASIVVLLPLLSMIPKSFGPYIIRLLGSNGVFLVLYVSFVTLRKLWTAFGWMLLWRMNTNRSLSCLECSWTAPALYVCFECEFQVKGKIANRVHEVSHEEWFQCWGIQAFQDWQFGLSPDSCPELFPHMRSRTPLGSDCRPSKWKQGVAPWNQPQQLWKSQYMKSKFSPMIE